ncbi:MAG: Na-translocating system protein MpsC family protein [Halanaerobium sp.]
MGELVDKINSLTAQIYKEMFGKGPKRVRSAVNQDILVIRVERAQNTIFRHLASSDKGQELLKSLRRELFNVFEEYAKKRYEEVVRKKVKEIYYDAQKLDRELVLTVIFEENIL